MPEGRKRLLWVSDSPLHKHVGQSRVARESVQRLKQTYDVAYAGFFNTEMVGSTSIFDDVHVFNIVRSNTLLIKDVIEKFRPDIVVLSHDCFEFPKLPELRQQFPNVKFVGYFTIDGEPIDYRWFPILQACHTIWSPTEYGKRVIHDSQFWLDVDVIPYGVAHDTFQPFSDVEKKALRATTKVPLTDNFVGVFVGHNHGRKNLAAALAGWKKFAEDKSDVTMVCITHSRKIPYHEWGDMPMDYDLKSFWSPRCFIVDSIVDEETMSSYLKISDVLVFPTIGEGFGLPILESMACGCVPIVTNFSGHTDFCKEDNSYLMDGIDLYSNVWTCIRKIVSPDDVAEALEKAYSDWKNHENPALYNKRQNGIMKAKSYDWDKSVKMMVDSIEALYDPSLRDQVNSVYEV